MEKIGNAILFQIDLGIQMPMFLEHERAPQLIRSRLRMRSEFDPSPPTHEYDSEPMELYWYARSARGMPLLQYLAFYQVLEFYYPIYSDIQAQRTLRDRLKDPRFNAERDSDLSSLLAAIRLGTSGKGYGDEKLQLRATLNECVSADELRKYIEAEDGRKEFLGSHQANRVVDGHIVPVKTDGTDLRNDVADRIYAIRCRIVHSKSNFDDGVSMMLPFSEEARSLGYDIELISFLAREVLIAASRPLRV